MSGKSRPPFPVIQVASSERVLEEPMGTKKKFWWDDERGQRWLFKYARPGTGEHWSEKIAAEVGAALGVPCAHVELAECGGQVGSNSCAFKSEDSSAVLVHGNELLQKVDETYPTTQLRGVGKHTVSAVLAALEGTAPPTGATSLELGHGADWFVGYLLLDALILNCDRHHENWGVLVVGDHGGRVLAPSYDHASSLGRELRDEERAARLGGRDPRHTVASYVRRARSAVFETADSPKPLAPAAAFFSAANLRPSAGAFWVARLRAVGQDVLADIAQAVPRSAITDPSRSFALEMMRIARTYLLGDT